MLFKKSNLSEIEKKLKGSNLRLENAVKALAPKHKGGEMEEYTAAKEENLMLQRQLSLEKGEETAIPIEWNVKWDTGAPCPYVISAGGRAFLIYYINEIDPNWDGTYTNVIDSSSDDILPLALVEFIRCYSIKFGGANDEVINGHPLWGKGLVPYGAHIIENSEWLKHEMKISSVHSYYNEESWDVKKHIVLLFHDELFECITEDYKIEVIRDSFNNVLKEAQNRLMN